jgi:segregation and condensation protein B
MNHDVLTLNDDTFQSSAPDALRPSFLLLPRREQIAALEALLFASEEPLTADALQEILIAGEEVPEEGFITVLVDELNADLTATGRVFHVIPVARDGSKGYQFATKSAFGELLVRLVKSKSKKRLSKAGLETLAIIAYRQPISKPELEVIRGVSSHDMMNRLLEKNLITITGRSEAVGKPLLYGTTDDFLRLFGLHSLSDLPKPRELEELMADRADILESGQNAPSPLQNGTKHSPAHGTSRADAGLKTVVVISDEPDSGE